MGTHNKNYISQTPLQVSVSVWLIPGYMKGAEATV